MKRKTRSLIAKIIAAILIAAMVIALLLPLVSNAAETDKTGPAYATTHSQTFSMLDILAPAFLKDTDPQGVAQQLTMALRYGTINQGDIWQLYANGYKVPVEALRILYQNGAISGYLYKLASGEPFTPEDFKDVYDLNYYVNHNQAVADAVNNGTVAATEDALFQTFLNGGMQSGVQASAEFNPAIFKANYPDLAASIGDNNTAYYAYYILIGKQAGMVADRLLKK